MIDVEIDIFDKVARKVLEQFPDAYVASEHVLQPSSFPCVVIEEVSNIEDVNTRDSSMIENVSILVYNVNVYSNKPDEQKQECKNIIQIVDDELRKCNMNRVFYGAIDNVQDPTIYRVIARYTGRVDYNNNLYWR